MTEIDDLKRQIATLTAERDEAREVCAIAQMHQRRAHDMHMHTVAALEAAISALLRRWGTEPLQVGDTVRVKPHAKNPGTEFVITHVGDYQTGFNYAGESGWHYRIDELDFVRSGDPQDPSDSARNQLIRNTRR